MILARPTPRAILFDVGGTLIFPNGVRMAEIATRIAGSHTTAKACVDAVCAATAEANLSPNPLDFERGPAYARAWATHAQVPLEDSETVWAAIVESDTAESPLWTQVDQDAPEVLVALKRRGIVLGAVSNAEGRLRDELGAAGLLDIMSVAVDSALIGVEKPDPRLFQEAIDAIGVSPGDCWMVGNEYHLDLAPALEIGVAAAFLYDRSNHSTWPNDCRRITRLRELL